MKVRDKVIVILCAIGLGWCLASTVSQLTDYLVQLF